MTELSQLNVKITGDNSGLDTAVKSSSGLIDQFGNKVTNTHKEAQQSAAALGREYSSLRGAIDPVYASSKRYEAQLSKLNRLQKAGKISSAEFARMNDLAAASMVNSAGAAKMYTGAVRVSRFHTSNLAAQFNDIGVMLAAGQSPLLLAMQQGTQISQAFNAMGGDVKTSLSAMKGGLLQMINPMSLLTIGTIAAGAALFQWGRAALTAEGEGKSFDETLKEINESLEEAETRILAYQRGLSETSSNSPYERIAALTVEISEKQAFLNRQMEIYGDSVNSPLGAHQEILNGLIAERAELREIVNLNETKNARIEEAKEAYENSVTLVETIRGVIEGTQSGLGVLVDQSAAFAGNLGDASDNALAVIRNLGVASLAAGQSQLGRGGAGAGGPTDTAGQFIARTGGMFVERDEKKTGGSKGASDPFKSLDNSVEGVRDSTRTEAEMELKRFEERQAILEEALEKRRITEAEHLDLTTKMNEMHLDKMQSLELAAQMAKVEGWAGAFGDLSALMSSENDRLAKIGRFAAKAQIGLEGIQSASSAWQKGMAIGGPPVAAAFAAMSVAKTAALMSQVNSSSPSASAAGGGAGAIATSGGGGTATTEAASRPAVNLTLLGGENASFSRAHIVQLVEAINNSADEGQLPINMRSRR